MYSVPHEVEQFLFPLRSSLALVVAVLFQENYHLRILHQHFPRDLHFTSDRVDSDALCMIGQTAHGFLYPQHHFFFRRLLAMPLIDIMASDALLEYRIDTRILSYGRAALPH